jgi:hypothetical protein
MKRIYSIVVALVALVVLTAGTARAMSIVRTGITGVKGDDGSFIIIPGIQVGGTVSIGMGPDWAEGYKAYFYLIANLPGDSTQFVFPLVRVGVTNAVNLSYNPGATATAPGDIPVYESVQVLQTQELGWASGWGIPIVVLDGDFVKTLPDLDGSVILATMTLGSSGPAGMTDQNAIMSGVRFQIRGGQVVNIQACAGNSVNVCNY